MSPIEIFAAISGLLCVWLASKERFSSLPVGIVNCLLFIYMFVEAKLYADAGLQVVFIVLSFYGMYVWKSGDRNNFDVRKTRSITANEIALSAGLWIAGTLGLNHLLSTYTDASIPLMDSALAVASVFGQWFLSKKVVQNWIIWISVDVFSIGMYAYKELYITSALYAVFLVLATKGFIAWKSEMNKEVTA